MCQSIYAVPVHAATHPGLLPADQIEVLESSPVPGTTFRTGEPHSAFDVARRVTDSRRRKCLSRSSATAVTAPCGHCAMLPRDIHPETHSEMSLASRQDRWMGASREQGSHIPLQGGWGRDVEVAERSTTARIRITALMTVGYPAAWAAVQQCVPDSAALHDDTVRLGDSTHGTWHSIQNSTAPL